MATHVQTGAAHHLRLTVADPARSREFYTGLLGFRVLMEFPDGVLVSTRGDQPVDESMVARFLGAFGIPVDGQLPADPRDRAAEYHEIEVEQLGDAGDAARALGAALLAAFPDRLRPAKKGKFGRGMALSRN